MEMDYTEIRRIVQSAQGNPALLELASIDLHLARLSKGERERVRIALEAAVIPHWVDEQILTCLLEPPLASEAQVLIAALKDGALVEPFGSHALIVPDTTRLALRQRLHREALPRFFDLSQRAATWFGPSEAAPAQVETIYHLWSITPKDAATRCRGLLQEWDEQRRYDDLALLGRTLRELIRANTVPESHGDSLRDSLAQIRSVFERLASTAKRTLQELEQEPPMIFICYAHADNQAPDPSRRWIDRFIMFLTPLVRQGRFSLFSDHDITTGEPWHIRIQATLAIAKAAVLMISPAFLSSSYIAKSELPVLLWNAKESGLKIFPVMVSTCLYEEAIFRYPDPDAGPHEFSLSSLQAANPPSETLDEIDGPATNRLFKSLATQILDVINTA
jgi:hypothetical protein